VHSDLPDEIRRTGDPFPPERERPCGVLDEFQAHAVIPASLTTYFRRRSKERCASEIGRAEVKHLLVEIVCAVIHAVTDQ